MNLREQLMAQAYIGGWKLVRRIPEPIAELSCNFLADCWSRWGRGLPQLRKNLARVTDVDHALIRNAARSYARYWREAFQLPALASDAALHAKLKDNAVGLDRLQESIAQGDGVILVTTHSGNWDMAGLMLVQLEGSFTTVAERLKPEALYEAFVQFREGLGFRVLPLTGAEKPFEQLKDTLRAGGIVCLLGERDLTRSGVEVQFFGETTRMPAGPAKLAIDTGAALHPVHLSFTPDGWGIEVGERIQATDVQQTVQSVADALAEGIAQHPEDWHMLQPLWLSDLDMQRYRQGLKD